MTSIAYATAANLVSRYVNKHGCEPTLTSPEQAREWVKEQWPDWSAWIGSVDLDKIATHAFFKTPKH